MSTHLKHFITAPGTKLKVSYYTYCIKIWKDAILEMKKYGRFLKKYYKVIFGVDLFKVIYFISLIFYLNSI